MFNILYKCCRKFLKIISLAKKWLFPVVNCYLLCVGIFLMIPSFTEFASTALHGTQAPSCGDCLSCYAVYSYWPMSSCAAKLFSVYIPVGNVEAELLHTYSRIDPYDTLILCVRVAVLTAVTLTVPIVLFPVSDAFYFSLHLMTKLILYHYSVSNVSFFAHRYVEPSSRWYFPPNLSAGYVILPSLSFFSPLLTFWWYLLLTFWESSALLVCIILNVKLE